MEMVIGAIFGFLVAFFIVTVYLRTAGMRRVDNFIMKLLRGWN